MIRSIIATSHDNHRIDHTTYRNGIKLTQPPYNAAPQHHHDSSRPTIGFPLGIALLLIIVFTLSAIFSCCYHWDKLRHLRGQFSDDDNDPHSDHSPSKTKLEVYLEKRRDGDRSLPVIMAGDEFPRFIATSQGKIIRGSRDLEATGTTAHVLIPVG
ncbi:hypothetical protein QVD17_06477 [Tagetes erecta]|uniref:Uncharacterized protein n=1 Tax=Tagetes erecta TaxID=13708 RepID=A0AAD8LJF9_TARER|nr:hypothetical protein QVD17_06477 [Tagetes erecta]